MEFTSAAEENILLFLPGWCLPGRKQGPLSCTYLGKRRRRSEDRNSREIKFTSITARSQRGEQGLGGGSAWGEAEGGVCRRTHWGLPLEDSNVTAPQLTQAGALSALTTDPCSSEGLKSKFFVSFYL